MLLIPTTAIRGASYVKYIPEQKAMIGKRAAEHGVVANLCIPDHFILVVTSYHSFYFYTILEALAIHLYEGCGLDMTRSQFFLVNHTSSW